MKTAIVFLLVLPAFAGEGPRLPMKAQFQDGAMYRWLQKPVLETRLLDNMENPATWVHSGFREMSFTRERAIDGHESLRLQGTLGLTSGYHSSTMTATRPFAGEDWSKFNRLSFWVYPNLPGFHNITMQVSFHNDGVYKVPAMWNREGFNTFELENNKWNHIVWEIANLARDKVTSVVIEYLNDGREPQADPTVTFDLDHLELQRVDADHAEGWDVAPGRISFSNSGYATGAPKTAIASNLAAREFSVVRRDTGETALTKSVQEVQTSLGRFQVLDFSEVRVPGLYVLRAGDEQTPPFPIGANVWREAIFKAINFFYTERCGTEVPGVHGVCHLDWQGVHGDKRESYRRQILNGIEIGPGYHLRLFPVWSLRRGTNGTGLSEAKALSAAAQLRGDLTTADLAEKQLEWIAGRNPFAQSLMYGEGYDYPPMYSTASGQIVGALTVGIETRDDSDVPYWPTATCYNYKEVWSHATSRWLYLVQDLAGPALVTGRAQGDPLEFHEKATGQTIQVPVNPSSGAFRAWLPEGKYEVQGKSLTVLPSGTYDLDLFPGHDFALSLSQKTDQAGHVSINITARGKGTHQLAFRTDNLSLPRQAVDLNLDSPQGGTITLQGRVESVDSPWVAVVVPDNNLRERQELIGAR